MKPEILNEFDRSLELFGDFEACMRNLIGTLLKRKGVRPHSITSRVKKRDSLSEKIARPNKSYATIHEITDLCGVRIITYFKEEVDDVAAIIEKELLIDRKNSIDKRSYEDPDRFGYQSLHYVVSLSRQRCKLSEYARFSGLKAEIQIRTVIQHAWAEIEHDLGYKNPSSIPKPVKRRFHRLAAMLEVADEEFSTIKAALQKYESELPKSMSERPKSVSIDQSSVRLFIDTCRPLRGIEDRVFRSVGAIDESPSDRDLASYAEYLQWIGIKTVENLSANYEKHEHAIGRLMEFQLRTAKYDKLNRGLSLLYLCYAVLATVGDLKRFDDFLGNFGFGPDDDSRRDFAKEIARLVPAAV